MHSAPQRLRPPRVLSIDILRGLTIALMILVNDPGDWAHVYTQLDHSAWNGFTLTDFVFPNFLFLVGVSTVFSLGSRMARGNCRLTLTGHLFRRAATLFAIGLFLSAFPAFDLAHLRLYGVLPRIALCYLAAGLICLAAWNTRRREPILITVTAAFLIGYWALMRFVPVPGFGVPTHAMPILDPDRNLAAWLDRAVIASTQRWLHTGSLYNHTRDPEGLLSTLPAIATTLIGCVTGFWLRRARPAAEPGTPSTAASPPGVASAATISPTQCLYGLISPAAIGIVLGLVFNPWFPINKNLWTSSYVLFAGGLSLLLLALCYWLIEIHRLNDRPAGRRLLWPWLVFGSNAITAYVFSELTVEIMLLIQLPAGALVNPSHPSASISAWLWTYRHLFARHASTNVTSVLFAVAFTAFCFLPNWLLWRRKIFLKI
jgi:predicted acyltransferase